MALEKGKVFSVDEKLLQTQLRHLKSAKKNSSIIYFPDTDGNLKAFVVSEAPVLSPALSAKYPEIRSFSGYGVADPHNKLRFSISPEGVQSMIIHADHKLPTFMQKASSDRYVVYERDGYTNKDKDFVCKTEAMIGKGTTADGPSSKPVDSQQLRKYRLAVSASGEYTQYHGGTVAGALAAINATVTRVNQVFETDLAVTLELVADTDKVIYTDGATDPYDGNLNSQVQNALSSEIGEANYDIGHLFHKDENGGNAGFIGRICVDGQKGSAYSGALVPEGDIFDLDFVSHEMGHQLGANHTWSFESEGTLVQAEPGSGTTIMGYAGITGVNDVATNGDDYFHYYSILQISENLATKSCGTIVTLTNNPPVVDAGNDYIIPKSTAFVLTGTASDMDVGDVLTHSWEQIDNGVVTQTSFGPTNPGGANFRSQLPSADPSRYFPQLSQVLVGKLTQSLPTVGTAWETVSDIEREMNFAFTVRDNALGGGQVVSDLAKIQVVNAAGPFVVTSQQNTETMIAGEVREITWDVANTHIAPVNAQMVDILLSIDGGLSFPLILADGVLNDGSHKVIIPRAPTADARLMVKAKNNVFFAVNASSFIIEDANIVLNFTSVEYEVCQPDDVTIDFNYEPLVGFTEEATFSIVAPPPGLGAAFTPAIVPDSAGDTPVSLVLSNTGSLAVGSYPIRVLATTATETKEVALQLNIYDANFSAVTLLSPLNGTIDIPTGQMLEWETDPRYTAYDLEIATDAAFNDIVATASVLGESYLPTNLENQTTYFWHIKPKNLCGEGVFGTAFNYTTTQFNCINRATTGLPLAISPTGTPTIASKIVFYEDLPVADLDVNLVVDHTFLADLVITLTSPSGTVVTLISRSCGELGNINVTFDDGATGFICGGNPAISGTVKPLGALSSFNGESILGEWILQISDTAASDGGSLKAFSMDICVQGAFSPDEDNDGVFDADDLCPGTPAGLGVDASGCPFYKFPINNFQVAGESESCRPNNDGAITVAAVLPLDYTVRVNGNGVAIVDTFSNNYTLGGLSAGTYTICIDGVDDTIDYEEQCYEVVVTEPEILQVSSMVVADLSRLNLTLAGSDNYFIEFNGKMTQTTAKELVLDLKKGTNVLKVTTGLACQGTYEEQFFLSDDIIIYPNPVVDIATIYVGNGGSVNIEIYDANGRLVVHEVVQVEGSQTQLDLSKLSSGTYFLKLTGPTQKQTVQLIKR